MNVIEHYGNALLQQHEGNRQLASALAGTAHVLRRRLTELLAKARARIPGAHPS